MCTASQKQRARKTEMKVVPLSDKSVLPYKVFSHVPAYWLGMDCGIGLPVMQEFRHNKAIVAYGSRNRLFIDCYHCTVVAIYGVDSGRHYIDCANPRKWLQGVDGNKKNRRNC